MKKKWLALFAMSFSILFLAFAMFSNIFFSPTGKAALSQGVVSFSYFSLPQEPAPNPTGGTGGGSASMTVPSNNNPNYPCVSLWNCGFWNCTNGVARRFCEDLNKCAHPTNIPATDKECVSPKTEAPALLSPPEKEGILVVIQQNPEPVIIFLLFILLIVMYFFLRFNPGAHVHGIIHHHIRKRR